MLYYLLNEGEFLNEEQFWAILHQEFHPDIEDRVMTIAQKLRASGKEEGRQEGKLEAKLEVARRMLAEGTEMAFIVKLTGLSIQQIKELQTQT